MTEQDSEPDALESLLLRVGSERDREAFAEVVRLAGGRIHGRLRQGVRDKALAEELLQETLLRMWRSAPRYQPDRGTPWAWMFTITRRVLIDHLRRSGRPDPDWEDPNFLPDEPALPDDLVARHARAERVHAAIETLPEAQRLAVRAAWFGCGSVAAFAHSHDLSPGTAKSRVRLAMGRLRRLLRGEDSP